MLNLLQRAALLTMAAFGYFGLRKPVLAQSILTLATLSTGITEDTGILVIKVATKSAIFALHNEAGTPTTAKLAGHALFNASKDNASTINVFWDTDQLKIQNKTAGTVAILSFNGDVFAG